MNPAPPPPPPAPLQPPQQNRPSSSCHRHPEENFTGFCPSCLFERLSVLDPSASNPPPSSSARKSSAAALKSIFFPELRRTKSFSASKNEAFSSAAFEPQRKSCDVRVRTTLCNNNNEPKITNKETSKASSSKVQESKEEEEEKEEEHKDKHEDDIQVVAEEETNVSDEIVVEEEEVEVISVDEEREELKPMKDHIDLDSSSQPKKAKGSFWSAATVFSKKLQKWRQKQKEEKESKKLRRHNLVDKPTGRKFRETQSEVADYGFGRRSCDIDPRFSLDAGRISFDDPRYSLDEPRASWDGYLIGRTGNFLRMPPPPPTMLSVAEDDAPQPQPQPQLPVNVVRTDTQIPVEEEPPDEENDDFVPGGSAQTKEYYSDSSRRRKSFDRSNSIKKMEMSELKRSASISNSNSNSSSIVSSVAKVTPASVDYINGMKTGSQDRDNCFSGEMGASVIGDGDRKGEKKSRRWSIWGLIHRRGKNKDEDEDRYNRVNGLSGRLLRSNSSVSWRNGQGIGGGGGNGNKGRDEFVLERNRSARYSSNDVDNNGLLRFYLTPLRGVRRNGSVKTSSKPNHTHSIARTVLGLY